MKFWLVCFGLLFIGAELWQWLAELGSKQPSGAALILGGMGLAAVSNAAHLPRLKGAEKDSSSHLSSTSQTADSLAGRSAASSTVRESNTDPALDEAPSDRGSISFKVRFPFR